VPGSATIADAPRSSRLRHDPALDGIRAVGVALVLLFHGGFSWAKGGFLGVSLFFTLSGFLITSLLLTEQATTGGINLGRFWIRRLRRLLPAALACLVLIMVLTALVLETAKSTLQADVVAAVADVANWRFYFSGQSYAQLFAVPSPVQHYWSLAIEEQFYLVFPVVAWFVLVKARLSRAALAAVLCVGLVAAAAASIAVAGSDPDLVYYATFTRAAEVLAGCLFAMAVLRWGHPDPEQRPARWATVGGPIALAAIAAVSVATAQTDAWLYRGGLAAFSLLSVALIATARRPGPVRWVLSRRPVVGLGLISYGVYLYHWPLFLWLSGDRLGFDGVPLFVVRTAVTIAVAIVSYRFLEQPIRHGRALTGWRAAFAPPVAIACIVAAVVPLAAGGAAASSAFADNHTTVTLPPLPPTTIGPLPTTIGLPPTTAREATTVAPAAPTTDAPTTTLPATTTTLPATTTTLPATTTTEPAPAARVVVFGDSTAKADAAGLLTWGAASGQAVVSDAGTIAGCGVVKAAKRMFGSTPQPIPAGCTAWASYWPQVLAQNQADVAVLIDGPWEVADHQLAGDKWRHLGDPVFDQHVHDDLLAATDVLLAHAPAVVWFTNPYIHPGWGSTPANRDDPINDPTRMDRLNDIIRTIAQERPQVVLIDFAGYVASLAADAKPDLRPDGVHFTPDAAAQLAAWFGPQVVAAARAR
jgi:peptidoglycan/LPS O-acetylase OafA/YrhL